MARTRFFRAFLIPMSLFAHHSFTAEYNMDKPLRLEGTVTRLDFGNPHTYLYLDVKNPDGTVTNWALEARSANGLMRHGFSKTSVRPGARVTIDAYPSKTTPHKAAARDLITAGGYTYLLGSFTDGVK